MEYVKKVAINIVSIIATVIFCQLGFEKSTHVTLKEQMPFILFAGAIFLVMLHFIISYMVDCFSISIFYLFALIPACFKAMIISFAYLAVAVGVSYIRTYITEGSVENALEDAEIFAGFTITGTCMWIVYLVCLALNFIQIFHPFDYSFMKKS